MKPTAQDKALAGRIYSQFVRQDGAQHIATEFALAHLSRLLSQLRPRRILEIGAGIGTITKLILDHPAEVERLVSTEDHPFCLDALARNIGDHPRWHLVRDPAAAPRTGYDLAIFDGSFAVEAAYPLLSEGTVCFVEGIRQSIREAVNDHLSSRGLACEFQSYIRPNRLRLSRNRKWLGLIPKVKFRTNKGCHIGLVAPVE